jgi:hypothetical protein
MATGQDNLAPLPTPGSSASEPHLSQNSSEVSEEVRYPDYSDEEKFKLPWKYIGYRVFSKWMASDQSFFIARRFGALHTRAVLSMQDELVRLEEELDSMDKDYSRKDVPDAVTNGSFRRDPFEDRRNLVQKELPKKLAEYGNTLQISSCAGSANFQCFQMHLSMAIRSWSLAQPFVKTTSEMSDGGSRTLNEEASQQSTALKPPLSDTKMT